MQEESGGRLSLGIGRGDTALFHLGRKPMKVAEFCENVTQLHTYLNRGTVDIDGYPSRIRWLDRATQPPVPIDIPASGPKVMTFAARTVERITFAVGRRPRPHGLGTRPGPHDRCGRPVGPTTRCRSAPTSTSAAIPIVATARSLIKGSIAAFAHFSSMPGSTGAGLAERDREIVAEVGRRYDSNQHLMSSADHSQVLDDDFVDRFAVVGDPERVRRAGCTSWPPWASSASCITGPTLDADRTEARVATGLIRDELAAGPPRR